MQLIAALCCDDLFYLLFKFSKEEAGELRKKKYKLTNQFSSFKL